MMAKVEVRYRGISDQRILTQDQLAEHGINVDRDLVWDPSNKWTLKLEVNAAFESLLRNQGHFELHEVKDDGEAGSAVAVAEDPDHPGDVVEGATTETSKSAPAHKATQSKRSK